MKSRRALLISLLLGLFAVIMVYLYVDKMESDLRAGSQPRKVYVASTNIPELVRIEMGMVHEMDTPARFVQPQATTDLDQIIGSVARVSIFKGSQITRNLLLSRLETGLAMHVDPLRRALAIAVDDVTGVAGHLQPGNRVDIYGTFKLQKQDSETVESHLILTNVKVLAVERRVGAVSPEDVMSEAEYEQLKQAGETPGAKRDEYPKNITISVSPEETIRLITAQEAGFLTVALRPQFDESAEEIQLSPFNIQEIIGKQEKTKPQRIPRYEQIRGSEISY